MTDSADRLSAALSGRYRIERELGAGGMATVYLAEDLKHDRKVAIKVLKPELAAVLGADRFVVEIKTTAALQHPHILPLFDSGTADSFLFYVMPYIQGETIREKLNRETQFGVDDAVRIAREVADALDYAHRHGVIHRDIKPENILLHDGRAMVMDFGIALAVSAAAGGRMTETGLSLGTPHYMSPEQATAEKEITPRSDVYSLASVLYEMLAGQPPHIGGAAQQVIMRIITDTARPVNEIRKNVPPNVVAAVAKALEKLPADRFENGKAFADALANPSFATSTVGWTAGAQAGRGGVSRRSLVGIVAVAIIAAAGTVRWLTPSQPVPDDPVVRVTFELPPGERIYNAPSVNIAVSPLGDRVAYVVTRASGPHTFIRRTSELTGHEVSATTPADMTFSPDGRWLAFTDGGELKKVQADGGVNVTLANLQRQSVRGMSWMASDTIVIGSNNGLFTVSGNGGPARRVAGVDSLANAAFPVALPDGKSVAFTLGFVGARHLAVTSLASHQTTVLDIAATAPLGMRDGHLLYVTSASVVMAVPFDPGHQRVTGDPVQVEEGIRQTSLAAAMASLSSSGTLWFVPGQSTSQLVVAVAGRADVVLPGLAEARTYRNARFSPDGRKVAVAVSSGSGSDIWVYARDAQTFTRLTADGTNFAPEWSPDGKRVLYRSNRPTGTDVMWQAADGSAKAELMYKPEESVNEAVLSPDSKWLVYRTAPGGKYIRDIFAVPLDGDRKPVLLVGGPAQESHPRISPDGKWLAYESNEGGRYEIYVRPFPNPGSRTQVSNQGGSEPLWSRSGQALFYRSPAGIVSVAVTTGATFALRERRVVLTGDYLEDVTHQNYDVFPDGSQFLMLKASGGEASPILVHNWGRELRQKLAVGKK